ncbi:MULTISPECIES: non-oxidative hydroxyarylic acid decarboxylases subunit D [unclassified Spirillospora]|uniref:non-oxidative hydroxyarylic acid decarboxylases subunit D n=1 Tax=unclassified Spirillospora TaxID=2642701 RepID=UPI0037183547
MTTTTPSCPRCAHETIDRLFTSPVPGMWDVLQCRLCLYCWRTTEPDRRTRRECYPESFRMTAEDVASAPEFPPVPPLKNVP